MRSVNNKTNNALTTRAVRKARRSPLARDLWFRWRGNLRERERFGLIDRPQYAYGVLRAADVARYFGLDAVTVCEFGVASGDGLMNLIEVAELVTNETGIAFRVLGFDTGAGLPPVQGFKEHPEIWSGGDFPMASQDELVQRTRGRAEIVFGDIADTVDAFVDSLTPSAPLGFASVDVDIYSGARSALRSLVGPSEKLLPAVSLYFDDVGFFFANEWCGELAAIGEFNSENEFRKIGPDRSFIARTPSAPWHSHMFVCHALDHPARSRPRDRAQVTLQGHDTLMRESHLY
jgi:hypothetical protein